MQLLAFLLAAIGLAAQPAIASLRVNPLIIYLQPSSTGSSQVIELTNVTDIELPFEVNVIKRTVVDGAEVPVAADDDFVIFPPQMIIAPGATQTLRVQFLPAAELTQSESYYIYVTQVPVELRPGMSGIRVNYRFGISAHVTPSGVKPDVQVAAFERGTDDKGRQGYDVTVANAGSRFVRLSEEGLAIPGGPTWNKEEIKEAIGTAFMLPGQTKRYFIADEPGAVAADTAVIEDAVIEAAETASQDKSEKL
ncbi:molecular chaperone [Erythrobacter sp. NFXS35]|uniref:fimbrial biogenesis chaperone n=1 Tax=Erythrobacter sp. NFXS35 TaxID=2818436 RepID=UPI0032DE5A9F